MGKSKDQPCTCCNNPKCRPFDSDSKRSWRFNSQLKQFPNCKFCNSPFVPKGKTKDSGTDGADWKQQNAKGRVRPAASSAGTSGGGDADARFREYLEAKCREVGREELVEEFFPPTPKTLKDEIMEAFGKVESAQASHDHLAKQCVDMEAAFERRQQELLEYADRLVAKKQEHVDSKNALEQARQHLLQLRSQDEQGQVSDSSAATPAAPTVEGAKLVINSYDPTEAIKAALAGIPAVQALGADLTDAIGKSMVSAMSGEARVLAERIFAQTVPDGSAASAVSAPASAAVLPPPSSPPPTLAGQVVAACGAAGGAVEVAMEIPGKRGADQMELGDDDVDGADVSDGSNSARAKAEAVVAKAKLAAEALPTRARGAPKAKSSS